MKSEEPAYNEAQPDASERILQMVERQQRIQNWELMLSFGLILLAIGGAVWILSLGVNGIGGSVLPVTAGLAVAAITSGRRFRRKRPKN